MFQPAALNTFSEDVPTIRFLNARLKLGAHATWLMFGIQVGH